MHHNLENPPVWSREAMGSVSLYGEQYPPAAQNLNPEIVKVSSKGFLKNIQDPLLKMPEETESPRIQELHPDLSDVRTQKVRSEQWLVGEESQNFDQRVGDEGEESAEKHTREEE